MSKVVERMYTVRLGKEKGKGLYVRNEGCLCSACLAWVEDRDDATWFASNMYPRMISREFGGRVIRRRRKGRTIRL